jgi:hypothetical protein
VLAFNQNDLAGTPTVPCAASTQYSICGTVTAAEDSSPLASVPVELLGSDGEFKATTKTDQAGAYRFVPSDGLTANDTYFITPAVGRTMSPIPLQTAVTALTSVGAVANLQIRGWTSPLTVTTGVSGTVVLISTTSYASANAPALNPNSVASSGFYSAASASNGSATLQLPTGSYYVTCWVPQLTGETTTYNRFSSGPYSVSANQAQSISCH